MYINKIKKQQSHNGILKTNTEILCSNIQTEMGNETLFRTLVGSNTH